MSILKFDISATFLFREVPLLSRFEKIKSCGIRWVELQSLEGVEPKDILAALLDADVEVILLNGPLGDFMSGGAGLAAVPGREREFRESFKHSLEEACILKSPLINIGPSLIPEGGTRAQSLSVYCENLAYAAELAADSEVRVAIEPLNKVDYSNSLISSTSLAMEIVRAVGSSNVGVQFDIYHTAMNGEDVPSAFSRCHNLVSHVQFSDVPGRTEPGKGNLDFSAIFKGIRESDYAGFVGAEYKPTQSTEQTLQWINDFAR